MDNALTQLARRNLALAGSAVSLAPNQTALSGPPGPCSVRLVEMAISDQTHYTMKTVNPESGTDPMPAIQVPAPACSKETVSPSR